MAIVTPAQAERYVLSFIAANAAHLLLERWLQELKNSGEDIGSIPADLRAYIGWVRISARLVQSDVRTVPDIFQSRRAKYGPLQRFFLWIKPDTEGARLRLLNRLDGPDVGARVASVARQLEQALRPTGAALLENWAMLPALSGGAAWGAALDEAGSQAGDIAISNAQGDHIIAMKALSRLTVIDPLGVDLRTALVKARGSVIA